MLILDGKKRAHDIRVQLKKKVAFLHSRGIKPRLNVLLIGSNPISLNYIEQKKKAAAEVGIICEVFSIDEHDHADQIMHKIASSIATHDGSWILQLPVPEPLIEGALLDMIPAPRDVDCLSAESYGKIFRGDAEFLPPTTAAILDLLDTYEIDVAAKHVVLVGAGRLVGKPLWAALIARGCTVTTCTESTPQLEIYTRQADIIISGAGKPHLITATMVKQGVVIIDAATSAENGAITGDVERGAAIEERVAALSPVPGGVGPVTVAKLLEQVVLRSEKTQK